MRKLLPHRPPLAYAYQFYAYPLAILGAFPAATDWVLSNYIQVVYEYSGQAAPVPFAFYIYDYSQSPWLETLRLNREWCQLQTGGVTGLAREAISRDYYVYLTVNERYVPERRAHTLGVDYLHDLLIYGVDDDEDTFAVLGFDGNLMFRETQLPQEDLAIAYGVTGMKPFYDVPFTLYRVNPAGEYTFDLAFVARSVAEYLDSYNSSKHFQAYRDPWDRAYGLATYDLLESYLADYARGDAEYDIRHLQVLWEHKRMMVARLARCAELVPEVGDLVAPYRRVERHAWTLRTAMLRHSSEPGGGDFLDEAKPVLDFIRAQDRELLGRFAAHLDRARG